MSEVEDLIRKRDPLIDRKLAGTLTPEEAAELDRIETELDAAEEKEFPVDTTWFRKREQEAQESSKRLDELCRRVDALTKEQG